MSKADVLIMSPSGFSYLAAMLSDGIKITRYPWWHSIPDTNDWIRVDESALDLTQLLSEKNILL